MWGPQEIGECRKRVWVDLGEGSVGWKMPGRAQSRRFLVEPQGVR